MKIVQLRSSDETTTSSGLRVLFGWILEFIEDRASEEAESSFFFFSCCKVTQSEPLTLENIQDKSAETVLPGFYST